MRIIYLNLATFYFIVVIYLFQVYLFLLMRARDQEVQLLKIDRQKIRLVPL